MNLGAAAFDRPAPFSPAARRTIFSVAPIISESLVTRVHDLTSISHVGRGLASLNASSVYGFNLLQPDFGSSEKIHRLVF